MRTNPNQKYSLITFCVQSVLLPTNIGETQVTLSGSGGRALVERVARLQPRMKVIYMSRNVDLLLAQGVLTPDMACLRKPFTGAEVLAKVQEVLRPSQRQIVCPRCSSTNVRRSRRKWLDWLFISTVPYRCQHCRTRFYRFLGRSTYCLFGMNPS